MRSQTLLKYSLLFSLWLALTPLLAKAEPLTVYAEISGNSAYFEDGKLTGYSVELVRRIMGRVGDRGDIFAVPWMRGYDALLKDRNVALFATTRTKQRDPLFHWIGPILRVQWILLSKKDDGIKITSLEDARKVHAIGGYLGDARSEYLKRLGFTNLELSQNNLLNYRKLAEGRIDLLVGTNLGHNFEIFETGLDDDDFEVDMVLREMDLYIAISKRTDSATVRAWQAAFEHLKKDGTFEALYKQWWPGLEAPMDVRLP